MDMEGSRQKLRDSVCLRNLYSFTITLMDEKWMVTQPRSSNTPLTCFSNPRSAIQALQFTNVHSKQCSDCQAKASSVVIKNQIDKTQEEITVLKNIMAAVASRIIDSSGSNSTSDLTVNQLEELVLNKLDKIFKSAIEKIVSLGYSKEVATKAVMKYGTFSYGLNDAVTNIVDTTLAFWSNGKEIDTSGAQPFMSLEDMEKYISVAMVSLIKDAKPSFSNSDVMRCLLISDMNVSQNPYGELEQLLMSDDKKDEMILKLQLMPDDEKEKLILKMLSRKNELQNQIQEWTEWANQRVMEAASRLSMDNAELKALRKEKESIARLMKERQIIEETATMKLSEIGNALSKVNGQTDISDMYAQELEAKNTELRRKMRAAEVRAIESEASCKAAARRENKAKQKIQSGEKQKILMSEELVTQRHKRIQLQQEVDQAKVVLDQLEVKRKEEEKMKEELLAQARAIRKERVHMEASAKLKESMTKLKAEKDQQRAKEKIRKLEKEIAQLTLKNESSKPPALRQEGFSGSSDLTDAKDVDDVKETMQLPKISGLMSDLSIYKWKGEMERERECMMCFAEERSVVFLPCAHQIICRKCNEIHEKQGMKDCPCCRTPIKQRIVVRCRSS